MNSIAFISTRDDKMACVVESGSKRMSRSVTTRIGVGVSSYINTVWLL